MIWEFSGARTSLPHMRGYAVETYTAIHSVVMMSSFRRRTLCNIIPTQPS